MAAAPSLPDIGGHRMSLRRTRQLSTSELHQSEPHPSPSETTRANTEPQPIPHVQRHSILYDSSDDEVLVPMKLSALTKALLNGDESQPGAEYEYAKYEYAIPGERPASPSAQPPPRVHTRGSLGASTSSISENRGGGGDSPAPRKRVVRISRTSGRGILLPELRRAMPASTQETNTGVESRERSTKGETGEYAQRGTHPQVASERIARASLGSSGRKVRSAGSGSGSPAVPSKRFVTHSDASSPAQPTSTESLGAATSIGVTRGDNSGKREDLERQSTAGLSRAVSVSGSLLGGPARRGRQRPAGDDADAEARGEITAAQDLERQAHSEPAKPTASNAQVPRQEPFAVKSQNTPRVPAPSLSVPSPCPAMPVAKTATATQSIKKRQYLIKVNDRAYTRIDCIGRGGSGKVYRVAAAHGTILALKRVSLEHMDELAEKGLRREIELLRRLRGVDHVIQLVDYEMKQEKQLLFVVRISIYTVP